MSSFTDDSLRVMMDHPFAIQYERTNGYESPELRERKIRTRVCIAGVGGGGALLAEAAAKEGYRDIHVADPDVLSYANANRLFIANQHSVGQNKAVTVAEKIHEANNAATVTVYEDGVTKENVNDFFLSGSKKGQVIIGVDEIDVQRPDIALGFNQTARKLHIPVVTATDIGFGGLVTCYNPEARRYTFERVNHIPADMEPFVRYGGEMVLSSLAYIPPYGSIDTLMSVVNGADVPSSLRSVLIATGLALSEMQRIVAQGERGHRRPTWAPRQRWLDSEGQAGSTYFPRYSHYRHLAIAALRDKILKNNPRTAYTQSDIEARAAYRKSCGEKE